MHITVHIFDAETKNTNAVKLKQTDIVFLHSKKT